MYGFKLVRTEDIPEINSKVRLFEHEKTGAQLISIENDDDNKCFGISFNTPPTDSTGLPHILEHSVLNGSDKYPVKEPFVELIKGSMATFLNAMTFPDRTVYPVASQNLQDFYNLVDVYLDAVFHPRISPEILMQEGWHYEMESEDDELKFKGVVFNEMKGAYSSPDNLMYRYTKSILFPDNTYGVDSGGDPQVIPDLTYEQFKHFHETYYHPSNARIYFYGDDNPEDRLRIINDVLAGYEQLDVDSRITLHPRYDEPYRSVIPYDSGEETEKKGMITVAWMLPEPHDNEQRFAFSVLEHILLGTPASPLRKALIDSGLGENTAGFGLNSGMRQMMFSTGMRGIAIEDADKVEALILQTLQTLAADGIDPDTIEASMNTIEFQLREYNTGNFPRGLAMMFGILGIWSYDGDPIAPLQFEAPLANLKAQVAASSHVFESMIREHLLENTHRSTIVFEPDPEVSKRKEADEKARLQKVQQSLTPDDIQKIIADTHRLRELQEREDSPEDLAKLPMLSLEDIEQDIKTVPLDVADAHGVPLIYHDLFTNGIVYLDVGFNLQALPQEYLPVMSLFSQALLEMGTETEDFVKLSQRIGRKTGGIDTTDLIAEKRTRSDTIAWMMLRAKATVAQVPDLLDILRDILLTTRFDNKERFRQIALRQKASMESRLVPAGHMVVHSRLNAHFSLSGWINEQMNGLEYLMFLRRLIEQIDNDWQGVLAQLEAVRDALIQRDAMLCNITIDGDNWGSIQSQVSDFLQSMPHTPVQWATWQPNYISDNEGLTIPAQVNYVGKGANLYELGYQLHGSAYVASVYLRTTWLWERIRVQGGAYGGMMRFDANSGILNYLSYRDPNLLGTLDNYDNAANFMKSLNIARDEVIKTIVGTVGKIDSAHVPPLPDGKGFAAMQRYLTGYTDAIRQQERNEMLSTTLADFHTFGEALQQITQHGTVVVLGSPDAIAKANAERNNFLKVSKIL